MNVDHLLARARRGIRGKNKPRQTDLRRRVSNTYHALFHALALMCADALVGSTKRNGSTWVRIYRSLEHSKAKVELTFALLFVNLQKKRHEADYDPRPFTSGLSTIRSYVSDAALAISDLKSVSLDRKQEVAAILPLKTRS
ncbi:MAG: hypothetical protein JO163_17940 [Methylobacteriaceae bacterium]|nr:hypothetical protein [Methylobacteriaceae bacterium]